MKILTIVGARPDLVKIAPLLAAMRSCKDIEPRPVHTSQHYDNKLSEVFFAQMGIPEPDFNLDVGSGSQPAQTAEIKYRAASNGHERNQPYSWSRSRKNTRSDEGYIGRS